jgi:Mn-dependent DtxR family transcriptional regulator
MSKKLTEAQKQVLTVLWEASNHEARDSYYKFHIGRGRGAAITLAALEKQGFVEFTSRSMWRLTEAGKVAVQLLETA